MSHPPKPIDTQRSLRAYQLLGFLVMLLLVVGVGGWGALAPINGAVIVPATVAVESYTKKVQHREGGIVSEIRVKEGDDVKAGEVLVVLSDTDTKADLAIIEGQLDEVMANRARLEAERGRARRGIGAPGSKREGPTNRGVGGGRGGGTADASSAIALPAERLRELPARLST